jgi:hypothetical protein
MSNFQHIAYPDTNHFREAVHYIKHLYKDQTHLPLIKYSGRVKLHGSNMAVVFLPSGEYYCQSRKTIVTKQEDLYGFARWVAQHIETIRPLAEQSLVTPLIIQGEFCGAGINKNVAINQLAKMFVVFATGTLTNPHAALAEQIWNYNYDQIDAFHKPEINLYNTNLFGKYPILIDFNNPQLIQNQLVEWTEAIGTQCPAGRYFGVTGECRTGEGLVFTPDDANLDSGYNFKSKDERHVQSKVKTIGVADLELLASIEEMAHFLIYNNGVDNRVEQAITELTKTGEDMTSIRSMGGLVKWIQTDIHKENLRDIEQAGLEETAVSRAAINLAKQEYKKILDANL